MLFNMEKVMMKKIFGFTLIELMIVIAIVGILASIGIQSYKQHETKQETMFNSGIMGIGAPLNTSTNCFHGFVVLPNGGELIDNNGRGVPCN